MKEKLFNSDSDRELWIRLNAQNQMELDNINNAKIKRTMNEALIIARSQCEFDEEVGKLRYTLADLLLLDEEVLSKIRMENSKIYKK